VLPGVVFLRILRSQLSGGPDWWKVSAGSGSALNLRAGPSTRYEAKGNLRNGEVLQNRGCRLTGSERWCAIRAAHSGVTGWVAGRYLVESGRASTSIRSRRWSSRQRRAFRCNRLRALCCASRSADAPMSHSVSFVKGPGMPGSGSRWEMERSGRFSSKAAPRSRLIRPETLRFDKTGDLFVIRVGDERFQIPDAVVSGG
jgi:hypothetical protein